MLSQKGHISNHHPATAFKPIQEDADDDMKAAEKIKANVIIEGANSPTTLNADKILRDNGIMIIPDILANAGGITASYFEWVQNTQNYLWKETEIHEKLIDVMITSFEEVWTISQKQSCDLRTAALIKGIKRVAAAKLTRGLFP